MESYPKILFPVDLNESAYIVAGHAASMAEKFNAELHVLHVIPTYEHHAFPSYEKVMQEIKDRACGALDEFVGKYLQGLKVHTDIVHGHTGRQILEYAQKHGMSMIVMGTHGRTEIGQLFFGSVAQRVVQNATIPVLTVNPACALKK